MLKLAVPVCFRRLQQALLRKYITTDDMLEMPGTEKKLIFPKPTIKEDELTPQKVVEYLDRFVIGQADAKRAIAISFRNRWRRKGLADPLKKQITPKNILMQGPTGCGKTELARRLANLTDAPFLRVEATKYTEIGYVGKDVSSIIQDLAKASHGLYKQKLDDLLRSMQLKLMDTIYNQILNSMIGIELKDSELWNAKLEDLKKGVYNNKVITLLPGTFIPDDLPLTGPFPPKKAMSGTIKEIAGMLYQTYHEKLKSQYERIDINKEALRVMEEEGIVFLDEIDKLAVPEGMVMSSKGVSTEGVQRDLLPIIEGTTVNTKYGDVRTDHILFIASGAFSQTKVTDLIPELLGRLPVRVEMKPITYPQFIRILKEPQFNLLMQQQHLMKREGIDISFTDDVTYLLTQAIEQIAKIAFEINMNTENTGARRLQSLVEKIMQDYSFNAPTMDKSVKVVVDRTLVSDKLKGMGDRLKLSKFLI